MKDKLRELVESTLGLNGVELFVPEAGKFGDYSSNLALVEAKKMKKEPVELAKEIKIKLMKDPEMAAMVDKIEIAGPGFINFFLNNKILFDSLAKILQDKEHYGLSRKMSGKKIMVEFAHPNTHKELHIGHMRTLITGEALSRILEAAGAEVFRANYQGDIGPHVAKAIWGTRILLEQRSLSWKDAEKLTAAEKAHLLGEGYVLGNQQYDEKKEEINQLNRAIYDKESEVWEDYQRTRKWSLDYYDEFYKRFGTKFDHLFFESEVADSAVEIVKANLGKVFLESEGAVVFPGEEYGLHTRVFLTAAGTPTYEGKEMALAYLQYAAFPFDTNIHVVANEQSGYFKVVIKAMETLDSIFKGREYHLSMGMVNLIGRKMSSRTGEILRVDRLLDEVKETVKPLMKDQSVGDVEKVLEQITLSAVKYSFLKVGPKSDVAFDIKQSVSLEGDSGPYLQYTFARTHSVLEKAGVINVSKQLHDVILNPDERIILVLLGKFMSIIEESAKSYSPSIVANYLYELAQRYNSFYNKYRITNPEGEGKIAGNLKYFRLALTAATGQILKNGLNLLGIEALESM